MFHRTGKSATDADLAYDAAQRVVDAHRHLSGFIRIGMTLAQIDAEVARVLRAMGCESCFYRYSPPRSGLPPFPNHACLSVNECVVHGTSVYHTEPLHPGDLLKIDIGVFCQRMVGDAAWTYSIGEPAPEVRRLMDVGKESLRRGLAALNSGMRWRDWAAEVERCVEREAGYKLVSGLGGHGYGKGRLHGAPYVANTLEPYWDDRDKECRPGTLVALEPMIAVGTRDNITGLEHLRATGRMVPTHMEKLQRWPIISADGSLTVHYEADVLVLEDGIRDLTSGLADVNDVVG